MTRTAARSTRTCTRASPRRHLFYRGFCDVIAPPTLAEAHTLLDLVKAPSVTSIADYVAELEECGFVDVEATDFSAPWAAWCRARSDEYNLTEADAVAQQWAATLRSTLSFLRGGGQPIRRWACRRRAPDRPQAGRP